MTRKQNIAQPDKRSLPKWKFFLLPLAFAVLLVVGGKIGSEVLIGVSLLGLVGSAVWGSIYYGSLL